MLQNNLLIALLKGAAGLIMLTLLLPISEDAKASPFSPDNTPTYEPGVSSGSPGMPDQESLYLADVRRARRENASPANGKPNLIGALTELGLHYNRRQLFVKAAKALNEALSLTRADDYPSLEQVLPPLVEAETGCKHLTAAEIHAKKLIAMARKNQIHQFPGLMFACNQYSRILTMMHRPAEAARFKAEAHKINSNIKGL